MGNVLNKEEENKNEVKSNPENQELPPDTQQISDHPESPNSQSPNVQQTEEINAEEGNEAYMQNNEIIQEEPQQFLDQPYRIIKKGQIYEVINGQLFKLENLPYSHEEPEEQVDYDGQQMYEGQQEYQGQQEYGGQQMYDGQQVYQGQEVYEGQQIYDGQQQYLVQQEYQRQQGEEQVQQGYQEQQEEDQGIPEEQEYLEQDEEQDEEQIAQQKEGEEEQQEVEGEEEQEQQEEIDEQEEQEQQQSKENPQTPKHISPMKIKDQHIDEYPVTNKRSDNKNSDIKGSQKIDEVDIPSPKDKNSQINYSANKEEEQPIDKNSNYKSRQIFKNSNVHKHSISGVGKRIYTFERQSLVKKVEDVSVKQININEEEQEVIEIPRNKYENYLDSEAVILNDGMDTGEYKFLGAKNNFEEIGPSIKEIKFTEEEIQKEINRRRKEKKEKKITYQIIDKFYVVTEIKGKTIRGRGKKIVDGRGSSAINSNIEIINTNINASSKVNSNGYTEFRKEISYHPIGNYNNINNESNDILIPNDYHSKVLLEQINKIRQNPQSFISEIEDAKGKIINDKFGGLIYNGHIKMALSRGESAFNEAIELLRNTEPMEPLQYLNIQTITPPQNEFEIRDKDDLRKKVEEKVNEGVNIKSYWRDFINDPQISLLSMIIDDNGIKSGMKRKDLLDPNMKFIGISSAEINRKFVCYITLSD